MRWHVVEDAQAWGLTPTQTYDWMGRLSTYHARRAVFHAERAEALGRSAVVMAAVSHALALLTLLVIVVRAWW